MNALASEGGPCQRVEFAYSRVHKFHVKLLHKGEDIELLKCQFENLLELIFVTYLLHDGGNMISTEHIRYMEYWLHIFE